MFTCQTPKRILEEQRRAEERELASIPCIQFQPDPEDCREVTEWLERRAQRWQNRTTT